jgi:hypothetical protein
MSENLRKEFLETKAGQDFVSKKKLEQNLYLIQYFTPNLLDRWLNNPQYFVRYILVKDQGIIKPNNEENVRLHSTTGKISNDNDNKDPNEIIAGYDKPVPYNILLFHRKNPESFFFKKSEEDLKNRENIYAEAAKAGPQKNKKSGGKRKITRKRKNSYHKKTRRTRKK